MRKIILLYCLCMTMGLYSQKKTMQSGFMPTEHSKIAYNLTDKEQRDFLDSPHLVPQRLYHVLYNKDILSRPEFYASRAKESMIKRGNDIINHVYYQPYGLPYQEVINESNLHTYREDSALSVITKETYTYNGVEVATGKETRNRRSNYHNETHKILLGFPWYGETCINTIWDKLGPVKSIRTKQITQGFEPAVLHTEKPQEKIIIEYKTLPGKSTYITRVDTIKSQEIVVQKSPEIKWTEGKIVEKQLPDRIIANQKTIVRDTVEKHVYHNTYFRDTVEKHVYYNTYLHDTIENHVYYKKYLHDTVENHVYHNTYLHDTIHRETVRENTYVSERPSQPQYTPQYEQPCSSCHTSSNFRNDQRQSCNSNHRCQKHCHTTQNCRKRTRSCNRNNDDDLEIYIIDLQGSSKKSYNSTNTVQYVQGNYNNSQRQTNEYQTVYNTRGFESGYQNTYNDTDNQYHEYVPPVSSQEKLPKTQQKEEDLDKEAW